MRSDLVEPIDPMFAASPRKSIVRDDDEDEDDDDDDEDEDEDEDGARRRNASGERPSALVIAGGALLGYLLYRVLR